MSNLSSYPEQAPDRVPTPTRLTFLRLRSLIGTPLGGNDSAGPIVIPAAQSHRRLTDPTLRSWLASLSSTCEEKASSLKQLQGKRHRREVKTTS